MQSNWSVAECKITRWTQFPSHHGAVSLWVPQPPIVPKLCGEDDTSNFEAYPENDWASAPPVSQKELDVFKNFWARDSPAWKVDLCFMYWLLKYQGLFYFIHSFCHLKVCPSVSCSVVSDSVWPTRLLRPWDSPGKNTGVGLSFPPPGESSQPREWNPGVLNWQVDSLPSEPPRKPCVSWILFIFKFLT